RPVRARAARALRPRSPVPRRGHRAGGGAMSAPLRLGTRKSLMATSQSRRVAERLAQATGRRSELVGITTFGDVSRAHLTQLGGTGVFVSELRNALIAGAVDFAVHSLKDLPTKRDDRIELAALPPRGSGPGPRGASRSSGCSGRTWNMSRFAAMPTLVWGR